MLQPPPSMGQDFFIVSNGRFFLWVVSSDVQLCWPTGDLSLIDNMICATKRGDSSGVWPLPQETELIVSLAIAISTLHTREIKLPSSEERIGKQDKMGTVQNSLSFTWGKWRQQCQEDASTFIQGHLRQEAMLQLLLSVVYVPPLWEVVFPLPKITWTPELTTSSLLPWTARSFCGSLLPIRSSTYRAQMHVQRLTVHWAMSVVSPHTSGCHTAWLKTLLLTMIHPSSFSHSASFCEWLKSDTHERPLFLYNSCQTTN